MGKIIKKFISSFLALAMTIGMIPFGSFISYAETIVGDESQYPSTYKYEKISGAPSNGDYLIVYDGSNAMTGDGTNISNTKLEFNDDGSIKTDITDGMIWTINDRTIKSNIGEGKYLNRNTTQASLGNSDKFTINDNRIYSGSYDRYYLNYSGSNWEFSRYNNIINNPYSKISYYKKTEILPEVQLTINYKYEIDGVETTIPKTVTVTKYDQVNFVTEKPDDINSDNYEFEKISYNGNDTTDQEVTVNGNATIDVYYKPIQRVSFEANFYLNGTKVKTDSQSVKKGSTVNVNIPSEVSGATFVKMTVDGEQKDRATSFTVNDNMVVDYYYKSDRDPDAYLPDGDLNGPDKPEYPNQGAVRLNKSATSDIFNNTGLTRVELGVTGVPVKKGIDVVIVLDVSGSMAFDTAGNQNNISEANRRITIAKTAAKNFVNKILADNEDGTKSNNRVSLVTFSSDGYIDGGSIMNCNLKNSDNKQAVINAINNISSSPEGGTDYDAGMQQAYDILNKNSANRNKAVLFLSDGAPENGYNENSGNRINPDADHTISTNIKNLGATVYTVGFGIQQSTNYPNTLTKEKCIGILRDHMATQDGTSSNDKYYKNVTTASALDTAFQEIATAIKKAGTEATLTDTIGDAFELQMATPKQSNSFDTSIKVLSYNLDDKGNRTGTPEELEVVTFSSDGKTATSNKKSGNILDSNGNINAEKFTYNASAKTFTWTIGDITSKEVVLSFAEYLTGAMEGSADEGNYPTNKGDAKLAYKSYKDKAETQTVKSPELPWGSASVTVEYYLVNKEGKPVNSAGQEIKEGFKIVVDTQTVKLKSGETRTINAPDYLPTGYELLNKNAYYTVNKAGQEGSSVSSSYNDAADKNSTLVSGTSPYTTSTVSFGVVVSSDLVPDSVVLDYGKPVTFNVLSNDGLKDIKLNGIAKKEGTKIYTNLNTGVSNSHNSTFTNEATDKYGKAVKKNDTGDVTYTLSKYMSGIDKFYYEVKGTTTNEEGNKDDFYKYSSISVIPATSVYYEDNFGDASTNTDGTTNGIIFNGENWTTVTDKNYDTTGKEEQDSNQGSGATYGQDSSYANDTTFSYGSARVATAEKGKPASAKFTFKGTGFEIISRTDNNTGTMNVKVYNSSNTLVKNIPVNTVYEKSTGVLYQIPVISITDLPYDQYKVIITVTASTDSQGVTKSSTVYIDGIRLYNPINQDGEDATEANKQYKNDKEANEVVKELRNLLLTKGDLKSGTDTTGVVFVDSKGNTSTIKDYEDFGPNNEVYLSKGNSIGFKLKSSTPASVKIGAKAPDGTATKVTIGSNSNSSKEFTLNTATSMYYDVTDSIVFDKNNQAYLVITNTGKNDAIVSLSKIKFTYDEEPEIKPSIVSNEEVGQYTVKMTLSRNNVEDTDSSTGSNDTEDKTESDVQDKPSEKPSNDKNNTLDKVVNTINNIFSKWFK